MSRNGSSTRTTTRTKTSTSISTSSSRSVFRHHQLFLQSTEAKICNQILHTPETTSSGRLNNPMSKRLSYLSDGSCTKTGLQKGSSEVAVFSGLGFIADTVTNDKWKSIYITPGSPRWWKLIYLITCLILLLIFTYLLTIEDVIGSVIPVGL